MAGANIYTGATTIWPGATLNVNGTLATAIKVNNGAIFTEGALAMIGGGASLAVSGSATLGGANTYTGTTTLNNGGVLTVTNSAARQPAPSRSVAGR